MIKNTLATRQIPATISTPGTPIKLKSHSPNEIFFCPEESQFYAQCLEKMVFARCNRQESVVEFGTGDGSPVISALLKTPCQGIIHGYELNSSAVNVARSRIQHYGLTPHYRIHNQSFFNVAHSSTNYLIANPPYLPAPDDNLYLPALHGGTDGASITKQLLTVNCEKVMLMISTYSNPVETIEHAIAHNYQVIDFMISPLPFGYYSLETKVQQTIAQLRSQGKAFYSYNIYFLAGVLFQQHHPRNVDLSAELLKVMTAL